MPANNDKPATKGDLAAVKSDLTAVTSGLSAQINRVAVGLVKAQADIRQIKETMATKSDINRIMGAIDAFAQKAEKYDRAVVSHGHGLVEVQVALKSPDRRITRLESARPPANE